MHLALSLGKSWPSLHQHRSHANGLCRIATWAAILTVLFRCPQSLEECDETSPYICKHYFRAKSIVAPHARPYYDKYAAPYVEIAQPYYDTVHANVLVPTQKLATRYGAPLVERGQNLVATQWELNGQPHLTRLQVIAKLRHDQFVAPHLERASEALGPYITSVKAGTAHALEAYGVPAYEFVTPYAGMAYGAARHVTLTTVVPTANWAWTSTNSFLDTAIWPQLRLVYQDNVEPQLVRIGERLERYRSKAKLKVLREKASAKEAETRMTPPKVQTASSSTKQKTTTVEQVVETTESQEPEVDDTVEVESEPVQESRSSESETDTVHEEAETSVEAAETKQVETDSRKQTREMVAADLEQWQNKFAAQAEEGAADIEERVDHISRSMIDHSAATDGQKLVNNLESTTENETKHIKETIASMIAGAEDRTDKSQIDEAYAVIRAAGVAIKKKAQAVRAWRQEYDQELQGTVLAMADVHFQILEETRSLALQQIGMKWAWTEGITYEDWAKYHELKGTFNEWTEELRQLIVTNPSLLEAQEAAAKVEDEAMAIASDAAKDLRRLKDVAQWKIANRDSTDEFDLDTLERLKQEAVEAAEAARLAAEAAAEAARLAEEEEAARLAEEAAAAAAAAAQLAEEEAAREKAEAAEKEAAEAEAASESVSEDDKAEAHSEGKATAHIVEKIVDQETPIDAPIGEHPVDVVEVEEDDIVAEEKATPEDEENAHEKKTVTETSHETMTKTVSLGVNETPDVAQHEEL